MLSFEYLIDIIHPALGSTQTLTEMNTRNISWGVGLTTLPPSCVDCIAIWKPQPHGAFRPSLSMYKDYFTFKVLPEISL